MAKTNQAILLFGAPGSGKGTQAEMIVKDFHYQHVATGDLFRENLKNNTELGKLAKGYMEKGALVPDDVTAAMLKERLQRGDEAPCYVLDGFPRTIPQARMLDQILAELGINLRMVLYIRLPDQIIIERLAERVICRKCQSSYNLSGKAPKVAGVCDACGGELYQRDDDKPETVRARLVTYHQQTAPLIEYYRAKNLLVDIDSSHGRFNSHRLITEILTGKPA